MPISLTLLVHAGILFELGSETAAAVALGIWFGAQVRDLLVIYQAQRSWPFLEKTLDWDKVRRVAADERIRADEVFASAS